jgi:hypothetical protein
MMMKYFIFCIVIALTACTDSDKKIENKQGENPADTAVNIHGNQMAESDSNCFHAMPASVLKKNAFSKASFVLIPEERKGVETIESANGDKIIITSWGCEMYNMAFSFETNRFEGEPTNVGFWYKRGVTLLNELIPKLDDSTGIFIVKGTERIMNRIEEEAPNGYQNLAFGEDLDFQNGQSVVNIEQVEQKADKRFVVLITFSIRSVFIKQP